MMDKKIINQLNCQIAETATNKPPAIGSDGIIDKNN